ncbi:LysR family transcriptional regulator [Marinibactrum halimedae]|uniref:LysR family transcriptional regulator n=1 Tax=Marinibactrum halimedae TaxID=1444977 RepID=A0AA37T2Y2_9GAMM|nr:LysR family transcriptional regulator [Marinibactrum halimedae]MCD9461152.1 LysR family transcriptional regulator [Marinibactrum halimedae]GLS26039.1 LysR family transcriptional regulator [Marinibactrum halimedae]
MQAFIELRSFIASSELQSFSAAARNLGLTPSAVSKHIRKLEDELGVRLFARSTRKIVLTDQGQLFLELCRQPTLDLMEAGKTITETLAEPSGQIRVSCTTDYGRVRIIPLLGQFMQQYPKVECELILTDTISDLISENYDLSIRVGSRLADSAFISRKLSGFELATCASPEYLEKYGKPKSIEDMQSHQCITIRLPRTGKMLSWEFVRRGEQVVFTPNNFISTNDPEALRIMALNHVGIIQTGSYGVEKDIKEGRLIQLFKNNAAKHWAAYVIYPSKESLSLKVRCFIDFLASNIC